MTIIKVTELAIYPVKSFAQNNLNASRVDNFGLEYDRRFMVVDDNGRFITQRQQSRMCLIKVELVYVDSKLNGLILSAPNMSNLTVLIPNTDSSEKSINVTVWHDLCSAFDCGADVADWLSQFLSIKCQLVYFSNNELRQVDQTFAEPNDHTAFSDGFPMLLISQASLDNLNSKLVDAIPMKRFRPNLVVSGCKAFEEDNWKLLRIGDLELRVVKPCSRCVIPSINTETGEREKEPTKTLLTYRRRDNKIFFGQNVIANSIGNLSIGDTVEIIE